MHIELVVDCEDADRMVTFWTAALGYQAHGRFEQYRSIVDPTGEGPKIIFQQVPDGERTPGKNAVHLDMHVADIRGEADRLIGLGATEVAAFDEAGTGWITLRDPEGHHFCVCRLHP